MQRFVERVLPVYWHEWPKVLVLLTVATLLGLVLSISRATAEALFLTRFGVESLPYVLLANPVVIVAGSVLYSLYAERLAQERMLVATALLPLPLIVLMRVLILRDVHWVYFLLYTVVLAYGAVLYTSWTVYLSGHYDVQEAKRLVPFITSGQLLGAVLGGSSVALLAPRLGTANLLWVWSGTLLGVAGVVWWIARRFTALETATRKVKRSAAPAGLRQTLREGVAFSRTSSLFLTTTLATMATMLAMQLFDYEYSTIFARAYPQASALAAFLGLFDAGTTLAALLLQWFMVPFWLRRWRLQGTNLLFPWALSAAFAGMLLAPTFGMAMWGRFTRMGFMPTLRGTTLNLMLNAVPRKMALRVRSFNNGVAIPVGQGLGALLLVLLQDVTIPRLFPAIGLVVAGLVVWCTHRQNRAYGAALIGLLREGQVHLLDLDNEALRHFDATAVAALSERLRRAPAAEQHRNDEESQLTAIELLQAIGSPAACEALRQHLPLATPRLTAAALRAMAATGVRTAIESLRCYLHDPQPQIRLAALTGLHQLGAPGLHDQAVALLDDTDAQVRAAALAVVLATATSPATGPARQAWHRMLTSADVTTLVAALTVVPMVPDGADLALLYRALAHAEPAVRQAALRALAHLAAAHRVTEVDAALRQRLQDDDADTRALVLDVLAALGTPEALTLFLTLLGDDQPRVRATLVREVKRFGRRAMAPLLESLRAPQVALRAKETAILALARLEGVRAPDLLPFWEGALRDIYQYRLMLTCLDRHRPVAADAFLRVAIQNAYDQLLGLVLHLLAVWASPEVARLVADGLHAAERSRRAQALEALESLGERQFTRLLLPLLEAPEGHNAAWQAVARQRWHMDFPDVAAVLQACLQSTDRWVVIGAMLAGHARAAVAEGWSERLADLARTAPDYEVRQTAKQLLGDKVESVHQTLTFPEVMLFVKQVPLYSSLPLDQLYTLITHMTEHHARPDEVIVREGEDSDEFYLIVSGQIEIVKQSGTTPWVITTLSPGDFFGEMAIFERLPRVASVVAVTESVLLRLSAEHFRRVILQDPAIAFVLFRELSTRVRRFETDYALSL